MLFYTVSQIISFYYILPYYVRDNITHTVTNKVKADVKADNQSFAFGIFIKNLKFRLLLSLHTQLRKKI